jgi:hypothetical protein
MVALQGVVAIADTGAAYKESIFFFEKKNQKTFATWRTWPGWRVPKLTKVFCFFSSEKKTFLQ